jgi:hypothetical protein
MGIFSKLMGGNVGAALSQSATVNAAGYENGQGQMVGGYAIPKWLQDAGATYLPGGGFGGNTSYRSGDYVYSGQSVASEAEFGGTGKPALADEFYRYKWSPAVEAGFAGRGSVLNGTAYDVVDSSGKVKRSGTFEGIKDKGMYGEIVAGIVGAALGGIAMSAAAGAGSAATSGAVSGSGISYTAAGAPVFGAVDTGLASASLAGATGGAAGAGISYTAGGSPIFGVVDTSFAAGPGISYTAAGAPVFGVADTGVAEAARAATAAGATGASGASGAGGGTAGGGGGAGTGGAAKAGTLGVSKVLDSLGNQALAAGASSIVGGLLNPKPDMSAPSASTEAPRTAESKTKAVSAMPDPLAQQRARKRSLVEQLGRRGRASTIMTSPSGRLGG